MVGGGYTVQRNKREKKMGQKNIPTEGALWRLRHPQLLSWAGAPALLGTRGEVGWVWNGSQWGGACSSRAWELSRRKVAEGPTSSGSGAELPAPWTGLTFSLLRSPHRLCEATEVKHPSAYGMPAPSALVHCGMP